MIRARTWPLLLCLLAGIFGAKTTIAVVDFRVEGDVSPSPDALADAMVAHFSRSPRFQLVERSKLESVLQEVGLSLTGLTEEQIEAGKIREVEEAGQEDAPLRRGRAAAGRACVDR